MNLQLALCHRRWVLGGLPPLRIVGVVARSTRVRCETGAPRGLRWAPAADKQMELLLLLLRCLVIACGAGGSWQAPAGQRKTQAASLCMPTPCDAAQACKPVLQPLHASHHILHSLPPHPCTRGSFIMFICLPLPHLQGDYSDEQRRVCRLASSGARCARATTARRATALPSGRSV